VDFPAFQFQVRFLPLNLNGNQRRPYTVKLKFHVSLLPLLSPGIFTQPQAEAWKEVTKAVHDKVSAFALELKSVRESTETDRVVGFSSRHQGAIIYAQIFAMGRANTGEVVEAVAPSPIPLKDSTVIPRELTVEEIAREFLSLVARLLSRLTLFFSFPG